MDLLFRLLAALVLLAFGGLILMVGLISFWGAYEDHDLGLAATGAPALIAGAASLWWAGRLFFNRPQRGGGLMAPWLLRCAAFAFAGMPLVSLLTGAYKLVGFPLLLIVMMVVLGAFGGANLLAIAKARAETLRQHDSDEEQS
jgi:hypothetical protein